jgi:hypothetical protein
MSISINDMLYIYFENSIKKQQFENLDILLIKIQISISLLVIGHPSVWQLDLMPTLDKTYHFVTVPSMP